MVENSQKRSSKRSRAAGKIVRLLPGHLTNLYLCLSPTANGHLFASNRVSSNLAGFQLIRLSRSCIMIAMYGDLLWYWQSTAFCTSHVSVAAGAGKKLRSDKIATGTVPSEHNGPVYVVAHARTGSRSRFCRREPKSSLDLLQFLQDQVYQLGVEPWSGCQGLGTIAGSLS